MNEEITPHPRDGHDSATGDGKGITIERFGFLVEDAWPIGELVTGIRNALMRKSITPQQISGLGKLLHGLQRLPRATPGIYIEVTIGSNTPDHISYQSITLSDSVFELASGGSEYTPNVGSDSYTSFQFLVEVGGFRENIEVAEVYNWVCGFIESLCDQDTELRINDLEEGSVIDWDEKTPEDDWDYLD